MTLDVMSPQATGKKKAGKPRSAQEELAAAMVAQAQEQGLALTGPDGLLNLDAIAEVYLQLHLQHRSACTQELDLRPYKEPF